MRGHIPFQRYCIQEDVNVSVFFACVAKLNTSTCIATPNSTSPSKSLMRHTSSALAFATSSENLTLLRGCFDSIGLSAGHAFMSPHIFPDICRHLVLGWDPSRQPVFHPPLEYIPIPKQSTRSVVPITEQSPRSLSLFDIHQSSYHGLFLWLDIQGLHPGQCARDLFGEMVVPKKGDV
jgi:hypothetical protein